MQATKHKTWAIEIQAKAKRFSFKLRATKVSPTWNLHSISVLLKVHELFSFFVTSHSDSEPPNPIRAQSRRTLKPKFLKWVKKIRFLFTNTQQQPPSPEPEVKLSPRRSRLWTERNCSIGLGSLLSAMFGFALRNGMFLESGSAILLCLALILKKREAPKMGHSLTFFVAVSLACFALVSNLNYYYFIKFIWKIWEIIWTKLYAM